jgi:3-dehydroquinate synthase
VDFGHTFSKIMEMLPDVDLMHGEAVNIDGFFSVLLARRRGLCSLSERDRIFKVMRAIGLPTMVPRGPSSLPPSLPPSPAASTAPTRAEEQAEMVKMLWKGLEDAVEHRHGQQRLPLIVGLGHSVCVSDVTREELEGAVDELYDVHGF